MLSPRKHPIFALMVVATDIAAIVFGFFAAYWFRFSGLFIPLHKGVPSFDLYQHAVFVLVLVYLLIFRSYRLYQPERLYRRIYELLTIVKAVTVGSIVAMAMTFFFREFSYSRIVLLFAWFFIVLFCCTGRYFLIQIEYVIRQTRDRNRVLIIGMTRSTRDLIRWTKENRHYGQDVIGVMGTHLEDEGKHFEDVAILGSYLEFDQILERERINEVVVADPNLPKELATEIMLKCESRMISYKVVADFYGLVTHNVDVEYISNVPLLGLRTLPLDDPWNRAIKRIFDILVSASAILILSPFLLLLGALVKFTSKGPVFYRQERVGQDGKVFGLYKFRTMNTNAEAATGPVWAKADDERVTPMGGFLRKGNLDELPQFWNVLAEI